MSKSEQPTEKRRQEARKKGQVVKSAALTGAVGFAGVSLYLLAQLPALFSRVPKDLALYMAHIGQTKLRTPVSGPIVITPGEPLDDLHSKSLALKNLQSMKQPLSDLYEIWFPVFVQFLVIPLVLAVAIVLVVSFLQTQGLWVPQQLAPDFNRINPANHVKQLFSTQKLIELGKNLLKMLLITAIGYGCAKATLTHLVSPTAPSWMEALFLPNNPLATQRLITISDWVETVVRLCILALFGLGIIDYLLNRRQVTQQLMMTKDEVKREYKEMSMPAEMKQERRRLHNEILNQAGPAPTLKDATAVVVNPTHIAVAIAYNPDLHPSPIIVEKGRNDEAQRIKRLANKFQVPIIKHIKLARALIILPQATDLPESLFVPLAEVLNEVYAIQNREQASS